MPPARYIRSSPGPVHPAGIVSLASSNVRRPHDPPKDGTPASEVAGMHNKGAPPIESISEPHHKTRQPERQCSQGLSAAGSPFLLSGRALLSREGDETGLTCWTQPAT